MNSKRTDLIGIVSAIFCIIHCILLPFLWAAIHEHSSFSIMSLASLDLVFLALSLWAVFHSSKHTHSPFIRATLWGSMILLAFSIGAHIVISAPEYLTYFATAGLITGHSLSLVNHKNKDCRLV